MKPNLTQVGLLAGALLAGTQVQSQAQNGDVAGPYLSIGAGINIANNVETTVTDPTFGSNTGDLELDPGFRASIAGGFHFSPMLAVELETGFLYNEVDGSDDVALSHVPILANLIFRFDTGGSPWVPFIGGGAGGVLSILDFDNDELDEEETDTDFVFAWQALAGLHYQFSDNMSVGVTYKYLGVNSPEFDIQGTGVEMDVVHNHAILGSFNWGF